MKKINKYILSVAVIASSWLGYGCNDFDYVNTNPDATTSATPAMLLTGQLWKSLSIGGKSSDPKGYFYDMFMTKQISWQEGSDDSRRAQYNQITTSGFGAYTDLTNVFKMVELAADIDKDAYQGIALFLKAFRLYDVSMALGDIPYSDAFQGETGNIRPKYDTQKEVMLQILDDLDQAYKHLSAATRSIDGDYVYNGDCSRWKKAVTAMQLRVLMSMSKKTAEADLNVVGRFSSIFSTQDLIASNDDNFQLVYGSLSSQHFSTYLSRFNPYAGISTTLTDVFKATGDYRIFYYCEPAPSSVGVIPADNMEAYMGVDPSRLYSEILQLYNAGDISNINNHYYESETGHPTIQLGYSEVCFILAEACMRGWISGDANDYYHKGIRASMEFIATYITGAYRHGVDIDDAYITSFLAQPALQLGGTAATFESDLKDVLTQKYLALFMHNTYTSYYDFRRTGYPVLPVNPETNLNTVVDKMPMRWRYEQREYDYNRENLEEALQRQYGGNDDWNELMWIIK